MCPLDMIFFSHFNKGSNKLDKQISAYKLLGCLQMINSVSFAFDCSVFDLGLDLR